MENTTTSAPTASADHESIGLQVAFSLIAGASFCFNLLFCVTLLKNPAMLKKSHNILLFSLAVVDMLTGKVYYFTTVSHLSTIKIFLKLQYIITGLYLEKLKKNFNESPHLRNMI